MERAITILTLCLLLLGSAQTARAQVTGRSGNGLQGRISGTVVDAGTTDPIVSATVGVWRMNDSTLVTGAITQENGRFSIEGLNDGQYYARISFVGFASQTISDIVLGDADRQVDIGTI